MQSSGPRRESGRSSEGAILYVAPGSGDVESVRAALRSAFGGVVDHVETVAQAVEFVGGRHVACLVTEYELPDGDSFELAETLSHGDVPVVVYTSSGTESVAAQAVTAAVDDYVVRDESTDGHDALLQSVGGLVESTHRTAGDDEVHQRAIVEAMQDGAFVLDTDGRVQYVNPRIEEITGHSVDSLRGGEFKSLVEAGLFPRAEYERYRDAVERVCAEGTTTVLNVPFVDASGEQRVFELILSPVSRRDRTVGVVGIPRDVTDREVASTQRTEVLSRMTDAFFALDDEWRFTYLNEQARQAFRQVAEPTLGEKIWEQYPSTVGSVFDEKYHEAMASQEPVTFETYEEGYDSWFEVRAYPSTSGLSVFFRDVTERKRNLRKLEATNRQLETVIQNLPVVLFAVDTEGTFVLSEGAGLEDLGREPGEAVGTSIFEVYAGVPAVQNNIQRALEGTPVDSRVEVGDIVYDTYYRPTFDDAGNVSGVIGVAINVTDTARLKDGLVELQSVTRELLVAESVDAVAETTVELLPDIVETTFVSLWVADESGQLVPTGEFEGREWRGSPVTVSDDAELPLVEAYTTGEVQLHRPGETAECVVPTSVDVESVLELPVGSQGVLVLGTEGTFEERDIELLDTFGLTLASAIAGAKRKEELQSREADLAASNERLDDFVSVVAHDLRNPISVAAGYLELARETEDVQHLERVSKALDRMNALIDDLLEVARQRSPLVDPEPVDLASVVDYAWDFVDTGAATLDCGDLPVVSGDSGRLLRLFENLIRNAVEHGSTAEGRVAIRVGRLTDGEGFFFEDDGRGIPPESRHRVFDHGYTTNRNGTGFGLAIVRDIANAHGWRVAVDESASGGARFVFTKVQEHQSEETNA